MATQLVLRCTLWRSPSSIPWVWHSVQGEIRNRVVVEILNSRCSAGTLACILRYMRAGVPSTAVRTLSKIGTATERHNCSEMVRWTRDEEWIDALHTLGKIDPEDINGLALRCARHDLYPRLVWWSQGRCLGYFVDPPPKDTP